MSEQNTKAILAVQASNRAFDFSTPDKLIIFNLKRAIEFYAKRYHDENHQSDSFRNCASEVCQSACRMLDL